MKTTGGLLAIWLLLAALLIPVGEVGAAPGTQGKLALQASAKAGYGDDGTYVIGVGAWFPVRVTLVNPSGAPSMRIRVEVDSYNNAGGSADSTYAREVDMPSPARKEVTLYAYSAQYDHAINVRLVQNSAIIATIQAKLNPIDPGSDMVLGVVSSDAAALNVLSGEKAGHQGTRFLIGGYGGPPGVSGTTANRLSVAHISLENIPDLSAALDTFGALVIDDVDTGTLSQGQHDALAEWVQRGGTLIVAASQGGADSAAGLADLLPVKVGSTQNVPNVQSLGALVSMSLAGGNVPVVASTPLTGAPVFTRVLAQSGGVPLAAVRDLGQGQVAYLALSPSQPPLRNWDGTVPLFKRLLVEHRVHPPVAVGFMGAGYGGSFYGYSSGIFEIYGDVLDLPGLDLPSGWLMAGFLLLYILVIGPVNFIVLRRLRRAELAWATIPALVLIFSVGAYIIAFNAKGGDLIMPRSNVTYTSPGEPNSTGVQVWGLFSPLRRTYSISVGANSLVSQFERYGGYGGGTGTVVPRVVGGDTTTLQNVVVDTGGLKGFVVQNSLKTASPLEADLHLGDRIIEGTLKNRSGRGLQDVALVRGNTVQNIGYMAAGASVPVKLLVNPSPFNNSSPSSLLPPQPGVAAPTSGGYYYSTSSGAEQRAYMRKLSLLGMALEPVLTNDPPTDMDVLALAWGGDVPVSVNVDGHSARTEEISLWVSRLPVVSTDKDTPSLTKGTPYWTYQANNQDTPWVAGPPKDGLSPYADVHFALPPGTKPLSLSLSFNASSQPANGIDILAYNARTGAWDRVGNTAQSPDNGQGGGSLDLPNPQDYTGAAGDVTARFQVPGDNPNVQIIDLDLILNGKQ